MIKIIDFPKIESPFVRREIDGKYVVVPEINQEYEWVFNDDKVIASEKLHGTCCAALVENGMVTGMFNRTSRIPFIGGTLSKSLTEGMNNAVEKDRLIMQDGLHWGELIGPKINGNPYLLEQHEFLPFDWVREHLAYKSWHKYPKTFENIIKGFELPISDGGIFSLFMKKRGIDQQPEGIVFVQPSTGKMAKIRRDMFPLWKGDRHKGNAEEKE